MEWSQLSILNATIVQKECEIAMGLLKRYTDDIAIMQGNNMITSANNSQLKLIALVDAIRRRIDELEVFYAANDDDDRAILFERERMKLRKAIQVIPVAPMSNTVPGQMGTKTGSSHVTPSHGLTGLQPNTQTIPLSSTMAKLDINDLESRSQMSTTMSRKNSVSPGRSIGADSFLVSPRATAQSKAGSIHPDKMTRRPAGQIYEWEGVKKTREKIQIDEDSFVPTSIAGVYIREDTLDDSILNVVSDKWMDVKVILTANELKTLVSRKKRLKGVKAMGLNAATFTPTFVSLQSSTPYIEHRRVISQTYRPDNREKWLNAIYHNK